jgi:hypothetical protein
MLERNKKYKELKMTVKSTLYCPLKTYDLHRFKFNLYAKSSLKSHYYEKIYKKTML